MSDESTHPIQVVAHRTGLSPDVLRAWEKRYRAVRPARTAGGRRLYADADVERLRLLKRATEAGRPIGQVAKLSSERLAALVREDEREQESPASVVDAGGTAALAHLDSSRRAVMDMDALALHASLSAAAVALGADRFGDAVVAPLFEFVGEGWRRGDLTPAHEHVATAVARGTLAAMIGPWMTSRAAPAVVVSTPPEERHELGAMLVAAVAVAAGWRAVYLGPDIPPADLVAAATRHGARVVALSVVQAQSESSARSALAAIRKRMPETMSLVLGGRGAPGLSGVLGRIGGVYLPDLATLRAYFGEPRPARRRRR